MARTSGVVYVRRVEASHNTVPVGAICILIRKFIGVAEKEIWEVRVPPPLNTWPCVASTMEPATEEDYVRFVLSGGTNGL